jgi:hypothetical protein
VGLAHGQAAEHDEVHEGEDGGGTANAEGEGGDGGGGRQRCAEEEAGAEA